MKKKVNAPKTKSQAPKLLKHPPSSQPAISGQISQNKSGEIEKEITTRITRSRSKNQTSPIAISQTETAPKTIQEQKVGTTLLHPIEVSANFFGNQISIRQESFKSRRRKNRFQKFQAKQSTEATQEDDDIFDDGLEDSFEEKEMPQLIKDYSWHMKGVDNFNQRSSYYQFKHSSWKWYRSIVFWLLELALNNAYYLYKETASEGVVDSLKFRMHIITEWEKEFIEICSRNQKNKENTEQTEEEDDINKKIEDNWIPSDDALEEGEEKKEEDGECHLAKHTSFRDCKICSNRSNKKKEKKKNELGLCE